LSLKSLTRIPRSDFTEENQLAARGNSQSTPKGNNLVKMGKTGYFPFKKNGEAYGSTGFNSCLGVLIVGDGGAIIGHYCPNAVDVKGEWDVNSQAAAKAIPSYFKSNKSAFASKLKTYIYAQVEATGKYTQPELVAYLQNLIKKETGQTPSVKTYKNSTGKKGPGGGFAVEDGKRGYSVSWA